MILPSVKYLMKNNLKKRRCLSQRDVLILKIPKERAQVGQTKDKVDRKKKKRLPYSYIQRYKLTHDVKSTKFSSTQFNLSVVSDSLRPHELQHARPPCPSPTPRVHSNSCPWSQWCHPAISSSVVPFSSWPQSLPASGSFPMSQLFAWGGQSTGVSASASFLPKNTQDWSPLEWTSWISLLSVILYNGLWKYNGETICTGKLLI